MRPPMREQPLVVWGVAFGASLMVTTVAACPFCGVVGQSLAERRDEAAIVAVGEAAGAAATDANGIMEQPFDVRQVLRGTGVDVGTGIVGRVSAPVVGSAVLFGTRGDAGWHRWAAIAADETLLGYVVAAPAWADSSPDRLRWYARWLEHPDRAIAEDAFAEFGLASFAAVRAASDAFDPEWLRRWVSEPGIDPKRRGFYGLALGLVAAETGDSAVRLASLAALQAAVEAPASDFRAGFDGLLGGLFVAVGADAIGRCERLGLFASTARPADQKHLLAALRFAWEELAMEIPREQIAAATARLLASPVVAADATIDLARYQAWDHVATVAALWESLGNDDPLVRRAVAGYLTACPRSDAREWLDRIREQDPARLTAALDAAALPK